jgi:hypothetical protein
MKKLKFTLTNVIYKTLLAVQWLAVWCDNQLENRIIKIEKLLTKLEQ